MASGGLNTTKNKRLYVKVIESTGFDELVETKSVESVEEAPVGESWGQAQRREKRQKLKLALSPRFQHEMHSVFSTMNRNPDLYS